MRLSRVRVTNYRSIHDSGDVDITDSVTCLVGKNESGKTSFLVALEHLSPVDDARANFDVTRDYPRRGLTAYKRDHEKKPATVVTAIFEIEPDDQATFEKELGKGAIKGKTAKVWKTYKNELIVDCEYDETAIVRHAVATSGLADDVLSKLAGADSLEALKKLGQADAAVQPAVAKITGLFPKGVQSRVIELVWGETPDFLYFDDYSVLRGRVSLPHMAKVRQQLKANPSAVVDPQDRTFLSLLELAGTTPEELAASKSNFESLKSNLEAAAIEITSEVFKFWRQNRNLRVEFSLSEPDKFDVAPHNEGPIFHTRIWNDRHQMTVSFDERSRGFVWFFSFLAFFSRVKNHERPVILLLDEPGLSLHAMAQADFMNFIEERLAPSHQVLYTTHSPFMVDPNRPNRVRLVEDKDDVGTVITADFVRNKTSQETVYPLMAAMGIELTQSLFVGPNTLLVEGPSELLYFPAMSKLLMDANRVGLDPRWTITPVNGADKVPAFVSLFGANKLNLAVVLDYEPKKKKLVDSLKVDRHLKPEHVIPLHELTKTAEADVEDLFDPNYYMALVSDAYKRELGGASAKVSDLLQAGPRVVPRVEHYFEAQAIGTGFGHAFVAEHFARNLTTLPAPPTSTLDRFEELFKRLNGMLGQTTPAGKK